MTIIPLNREVLFSRIGEIQRDLDKLERLKSLSFDRFQEGEHFAIAEHYLRRALEAVFEIGSHILSRLPGIRFSTYKEIAIGLGNTRIVPREFATHQLQNMAGYRNRLVHFYAEVSVDELYQIIQTRLEDFSTFLSFIKDLLTNPRSFGFTLT